MPKRPEDFLYSTRTVEKICQFIKLSYKNNAKLIFVLPLEIKIKKRGWGRVGISLTGVTLPHFLPVPCQNFQPYMS